MSCIMPTRNRRQFVSRAVRQFVEQDYEPKELLVVDDAPRGGQPKQTVEDLVAGVPGVSYLHTVRPMSLGDKRNLACRLARGSIIVHWDDDDWMSDRRLSIQIEALLQSRASLCGLADLRFYEPSTDRAWRYGRSDRSKPWLAGGTLCYRRAFWKRHPFESRQVAEDGAFVRCASPSEILAIPDSGWYVATIHDGNTSPKRPPGPVWHPVDASIVRALMSLPTRTPDPAPAASAHRGRAPVVVSVPYFGCRTTLRRAVESILSQSFEELTVVVVNDGDESPAVDLRGIDDERLLVHDLSENRGRYFADALVACATDAEYLLIHDADDWSEPRRLEALLELIRAEGSDGALSASWCHHGEGARQPTLDVARDWGAPLDGTLRHRGHHHGLFRTDALRRVGGSFGGFRIGYDSLLVNFLLMVGRLSYTKEPLYHRQIRPSSLSNSAATGHSSHARREVRRRLSALYGEAFAAHGRLTNDSSRLAKELQGLASRHVTDEARTALASESARLRVTLARSGPATTDGAGWADFPGNELIRELPWSPWSIGAAGAQALVSELLLYRPKSILECGSGASTVLLAAYAKSHGATVITLEHDGCHAEKTRELLAAHGLAGHVQVKSAPLKDKVGPDGRSHPWYDDDPKGPFDFVLIDGPPDRFGREAALFCIAGQLARVFRIWLHDANRAGERRCLASWRRFFDFSVRLQWPDDRGVGVIDGKGPLIAAPRASPGTLAVSLVTGGRLDLLKQTLEALSGNPPTILADHPVAVAMNRDDPDTLGFLKSSPFVDAIAPSRQCLTVGQATSRAVTQALDFGPDVLLHLEDDWLAQGPDDRWLAPALALLESPAIGQVRLRRADDGVLARHMVTGNPLTWHPFVQHAVCPSAHFTFNPSVFRANVAGAIFPCSSEREAQQKYLGLGLASAQLIPGVFCHSGEGRSLRKASTPPLRASPVTPRRFLERRESR